MVRERWAAAVGTGQPFREGCRIRHWIHTAEARVLVQAHPVCGPSGNVLRWVGTTTDVTTEHFLREELVRTRARLRESQVLARVGTWEWSLDHDCMWWSREVYCFFSVDSCAFRPTLAAYLQAIPDTDRSRVEELLRAGLESGGFSVVHAVQSPDTEEQWLRVVGRVVEMRAGKPTKVAGTIQDITEQHLLQRREHEQDRLESVGRLAGGVAHDFNNILGIVLGTAEHLDERLEAESPLREDVLDILDATRRAVALTRQLLATGSKQVLRRSAVDLNTLMANMQRLVNRAVGPHVSVTWEPSPESLPVCVDVSQVEQAVLNIVINAGHAMEGRGTIHIRTSRAPKSGAAVDGSAGEVAVVAIQDSGPGIPPEQLDRIFEPYFTTKATGMGLGLASCLGIARQHGGGLHAESPPGHGARFIMHLPVEAEVAGLLDPDSLGPGDSSAGAPEPAAAVLVVDDERGMRTMLRRHLGSRGFHVLEASSGEEAIEVLNGASGDLGLILADIRMGGITGVELAEYVHRFFPSVPVLLMSGFTDPAVADLPLVRLAGGLISKPLDLDLLTRRRRRRLAAALDRVGELGIEVEQGTGSRREEVSL